MITVLRAYVDDGGQEKCIKKPEEIIQLLSNPVKEIDLDYDNGNSVQMGTSKDLIGQPVKVGEYDILVPEH